MRKPSKRERGTSNRTHVTDRTSRWICIYPAYLNAAKTRAEGRHIAKKDCVVNPTYLEIRDVLATAGLAPIVENKKHPRERSNEIEFRGRIRVQLKNEDGTPFKEEFKTRELTLMYLFAARRCISGPCRLLIVRYPISYRYTYSYSPLHALCLN